MARPTPHPGVVSATPLAPEPVYFTHAGALYWVRIWKEREQAVMPAKDRTLAEYVPGLGWVVGDFIASMN
jgi:hypothetical protein